MVRGSWLEAMVCYDDDERQDMLVMTLMEMWQRGWGCGDSGAAVAGGGEEVEARGGDGSSRSGEEEHLGIDIQDMSCPICDNAIESTDHLFFRCGLVRDIANKVLSWWNLDHANLNSYAEWNSWLVSIRMDSKLKKMFEGVWLEKEKSHRRGKVYSWETTTYDKILYNEDVHNLRSVETEFLAIVFDNAFTSEVTLSYEPTVSSLNNEINFRISFDESDDEDYT
ncbi:hypothetical protein Tco_1562604, partial [Tanacetum coccineum]